MRIVKRRAFISLLVCILISSISSQSIVWAVTVEETAKSQTESAEATIEKAPGASTSDAVTQTTEDSIDESTTSSEQTPKESTGKTADSNVEPTIKETVVEKTYEDRELSDTLETSSFHPIVQLDEKTLTETLKVKGKLMLHNEETAETAKTCVLKKVVLQTKAEEETAGWVDEKEFDVDESVDLTEKEFSFDYEKQIEETQQVRLIVDYEVVDTTNEAVTTIEKHKGSYLIGETAAELVVQGPLLPSEEDSVSSISPFWGIYPYVPEVEYLGTYNHNWRGVKIISITSRSATIQVQTASQSIGSPGPMNAIFSTSWELMRNCKSDYSTFKLNASEWAAVKANADVIAELSVGSDDWTSYYSNAVTGLLPDQDYHMWLFRLPNATTGVVNIIGDVGGIERLEDEKVYYPYVFHTGPASPLTLNKPTFNQTSASKNSITMNKGSYTGDITQTSGKGIVEVSSNNKASVANKVTTLGHETKTDGTYNSVTVPNLAAGTKHYARVKIKDYDGVEKTSGWSSEFYTPNTVTKAETSSEGMPMTSNSAKAEITGSYVVSSTAAAAAHPSDVKVQVKTDYTDWQDITTTTTPATSTPAINTGSKSVSFTLSKLNAKTKYYVRYSVKNASKVWSSYSEANDVKTKGVILQFPENKDKPTFDQSTATATSIKMNQGEYSGDISQTNNNGTVVVNSNGWEGNENKIINLGHTTTQDGTYDSVTVTGLTPGTKHAAKVLLPNWEGVDRHSAWSDYFYTPNTVNQPTANSPDNPTTANNAKASVEGTYVVGPTKAAAHPSETKVQVSTDNSNWTTVTSTTTPATSTPVINTGSKKVSFNLSKLKSGTKYYIRYAVKNASGKFSEYSDSCEVTTKGLQLTINEPTIFQTDDEKVGPTFVHLGATKYYGDISQTGTNGVFNWLKGSETDWSTATTAHNNLAHDQVTGVEGTTSTINNDGHKLISGLTPGTKYKGRLTVPDRNNVLVHSAETLFCTAVTVNEPTSSATEEPITSNTAKATVHGSYNVDDSSPAHANDAEIQISLTGQSGTWTTLETTANAMNPALESEPTITESSKAVEFELKNLNENTTYHVRYRMKNESNKWSDWSASEPTVTTLSRTPGYYFNAVPSFNFGYLVCSATDTMKSLTSTTGAVELEIENVGMVNNWQLSAKLDPMTTVDGSDLELSHASMIVGKKLMHSTDSGNTWNDVTTSFNVGNDETEVLPSNVTVPLWGSPNTSEAQGKFKYTIERNSVKLKVLGGTAEANKAYQGKITWTMGVLP